MVAAEEVLAGIGSVREVNDGNVSVVGSAGAGVEGCLGP